METFGKYRNTILKYAFLLFLMFFTVYLVFKNLDINSIDKIKNIIDRKYIGIAICAILISSNSYIFGNKIGNYGVLL